jgi:aminopeptidase N
LPADLPTRTNQQTADAATKCRRRPATIRREDYRPPDWLVPEVALDFALGLDETAVTAKLSVRRNPQGSAADAAPQRRRDCARAVKVDGTVATTGGWTGPTC